MPTVYNIYVKNQSSEEQNFFLFQQPAKYAGSSKVYTNSIAEGSLPPYNPNSSAQIDFTVDLQFYAGVQTQTSPPQVGHADSSQITSVPIDITSTSNPGAKNATEWTNDPAIVLSDPVHKSKVEKGAFRIGTPVFKPSVEKYNAGLSAESEGKIILSNFINAEPQKNIDVQPQITFYVATGSFKPGTVVDFDVTSKTSAVCDASTGTETFYVVYTAEGAWTVTKGD